jgi:hypothetical protein
VTDGTTGSPSSPVPGFGAVVTLLALVVLFATAGLLGRRANLGR